MESGPALSFDTPDIGVKLAANTIVQPAPSDDAYGVILQSALSQPNAATDLEGNLIWYYNGDINFITRPSRMGDSWLSARI
jgi:hypothetical protein